MVHMNLDQPHMNSVGLISQEPAIDSNKLRSKPSSHTKQVNNMHPPNETHGWELMRLSQQPLHSCVQVNQPNSQSVDAEEAHTDDVLYDIEFHCENNDVKMEEIHTEESIMMMSRESIISLEFEHQLQVTSELDHHQLQLCTTELDLHPIDSCNMLENIDHMVNFSEATIDPSSCKPLKKRRKSVVWEHFTIENVGNGCRRACCNVCKQSFAYSNGSKVSGTSHLKRHIAKGSCTRRRIINCQQENNNQLVVLNEAVPQTATIRTTGEKRKRYSNSTAFDQDLCRREIAKMIITHDYPLHMVEHPGFLSLIRNLQPRFFDDTTEVVVDKFLEAVQGDCVAIYLKEKQSLQTLIDGIPGRICLAVDMWSSAQSTGYIFINGQFIDQDWKLHRKLLNVVMEPFPESVDSAFIHAVETCLSCWNLENKLCSVTLNHHQHSLSVSESKSNLTMRGFLCVKNRSVNSQLLLTGCCLARGLSGMAQELLSNGLDTISKIRTYIKVLMMTSEDDKEENINSFRNQMKKVKQLQQQQLKIQLNLDNTTRWDTTCHMLQAATELKKVFSSCLETEDEKDTNGQPAVFKDIDWKQVEDLCFFFKLFHDTATNIFLAKKTPQTSNMVFQEMLKIQAGIACALAARDDPFMTDLAKTLQDKFMRYWRSSFLILAVSVAMDPRFKLKLVEFTFEKLFGKSDAHSYIRMVDEWIHNLFHEYATTLASEPEDGGFTNEVRIEEPNDDLDRSRSTALITGSSSTSIGLSEFDKYIKETTSQKMKSELDQYLEESLLPRSSTSTTTQNEDIFDVLSWWKYNRIKYPTLSKMARDILSIPLSSVGPDQVFDTVGREMDMYRSTLRPHILEALICTKDWL